eukprot:CAMPEP_0180367508 /NCGR_PEP_ID=MMETSP0989-20121125/16891_1 /TAXON_ID=697907 /ORGANISM="non described non described, Strain CCMP2293" /LENGTH=410 /DNA_ID=CAMNT_0022361605 /DNA_START=48 /DNA_END=1281 /DNA_ORIENTATION=-
MVVSDEDSQEMQRRGEIAEMLTDQQYESKSKMRKAPHQRARANFSSMPRALPGGACWVLLIVVGFLERVLQGGGEAAEQRGQAKDADKLVKAAAAAANPVAHSGPQQAVLGKREVLPDEVEVVYQTPSTEAKGVILMAHGCAHAATDFFDKGPECTACIGLPVERAIVAAALDRGFMVVAVSSGAAFRKERSKCWSPLDDLARVQAGLRHVLEKHGQKGKKLPLVVLGASSGGRMALEMAIQETPPAAVAIQIMPVPPTALTEKFPPAIFWHMPRDERSARKIAEDLARLSSLKRPTLELKCNPKAITGTFFSDMMPDVSGEVSLALYTALNSKGLLDEKGFLLQDPRKSGWREALKAVPQVSNGGLSLAKDQSGVSELMNVAWASHEFCLEGLDQAIDFLATHAFAKPA